MRCDHRPPLFVVPGQASGALGCRPLPRAIVMHQSGPMRAAFRTPSPQLTRLSGAFFRRVTLPQSSEGRNSAHRHHPFNSGLSPFTFGPFLQSLIGQQEARAMAGQRASKPADLRSILRTKKDTICLQHAAVAHVYETGRQSCQHEAQRMHEIERLLDEHVTVVQGCE